MHNKTQKKDKKKLSINTCTRYNVNTLAHTREHKTPISS